MYDYYFRKWLSEVFRVSRHGNTFWQVEVIFNGDSPACTGCFLQSPSGMRMMELSVSVRNASDVLHHGIPGVFGTCGPQKGEVFIRHEEYCQQ